jgi:hypothetical protein
MRRFWILLAACGGAPPPTPELVIPSSPQPSRQAMAPGAGCQAAAANVASVLHLDDDHASALVSVVEHHCRVDAWTPAAQRCVAVAVDHDAALQCAYKHLTQEQHDLVVHDIKPLLPPAAAPRHDAPTGTQAEIAARDNAEGEELLVKRRYADASLKFRDAVARVPEARYFFNLCASLFEEGRFGEAHTACDAAGRSGPSAELRARIEKLVERIVAEARAQNIDLDTRH